MIYLVTYTIRSQKRLAKLTAEITASDGWAHHIDNSWFVATREDANQLYRRLAQHIDNQDLILVVSIPPQVRTPTHIKGWLPEEAWKWLRENISY